MYRFHFTHIFQKFLFLYTFLGIKLQALCAKNIIIPNIHVEKKGNAIKATTVNNFAIPDICEGYIKEKIIKQMTQITYIPIKKYK